MCDVFEFICRQLAGRRVAVGRPFRADSNVEDLLRWAIEHHGVRFVLLKRLLPVVSAFQR